MAGFLIGLVVIPIIIGVLGIRIVRPTHRGLIERFGKYNRFAAPGFNWVIPGLETLIPVNITECMVDVEPQDIITKDNLNARVDLMVYYKIREDEENVKRSVYNVDNFQRQIVSLAQTTARNVIGDMRFVQVNNQRNELNTSLAKVLDKESDNWGVRIVRVELKEITPPGDVQATMNTVIKAENEKIAAIDFATATETKADGQRRSEIKQAEGIKQANILKAEGEATAIKLVNEAAEKYFVGNAKELKKLEVTQKSLEKNSKIILTENGITPQIIVGNLPIEKEEAE